MTHWLTSRPVVGGDQPGGPLNDVGAHVVQDSILLATYSSFPRSQFAQTMLDVLTLLVWMFLGAISVVGVGGAFFILIFLLFFG